MPNLLGRTRTGTGCGGTFDNPVLGRLKQQEHLFQIGLAVNRDTHTRAQRREEVTTESSATNGTSISPPTPPPRLRDQKGAEEGAERW